MAFFMACLLSARLSDASIFKGACDEASPTLVELHKRLDQADAPRAWRTVYQETADALKVLDERWRVGLTQSDSNMSDTKSLNCAHAVALESSLYLSDERMTGPLWAMRAIGHAVSLSSLKPDIFEQRSLKPWLKLILKRVTFRPRKRPFKRHRVQLSNIFGAWTQVSAPAQGKPYLLSLTPHLMEKWTATCGLMKGCQALSPWRIYSRRGAPLRFSVPVGRYHADWAGPCVTQRRSLSVKRPLEGSTRDTQELELPSLKCASKLVLRDGTMRDELDAQSLLQSGALKLVQDDDGTRRPLSSISLPERARVHVLLEGYLPAEVEASAWGEPVKLEMKRCARSVKVIPTPPDAEVSGPSRVYWGQSARFTVARSGYLTTQRSVTLSRASGCRETPHQERVELSREVEVIARDKSGLNLPLDELFVGGLAVDAQRDVSSVRLMRPAGRYRVDARVSSYAALASTLSIPTCELTQCDPVKLELVFHPPPPPPKTMSHRLRWLGSGLILAGATTLGFAYQRERHYDHTLNYTHDLPRARDEVKSTYGWGAGLLAAGAITGILGLIWPALTSDDAPEAASMRGSP